MSPLRRLHDTKAYKVMKEIPGWIQVIATIVVVLVGFGMMKSEVRANIEKDKIDHPKYESEIKQLEIDSAALKQALISLSEASVSTSRDIREIRNFILNERSKRH